MVSEANEPGSEHAARSPRIVRRSRHDYPDGLLVVRRALGDPGEDGEDLGLGEATTRRGEAGAALRHQGAAAGQSLAEDAVRDLAAPDAARLHAQQLAGGGADVDAARPRHGRVEALHTARAHRWAGMTARDRAARREDRLHVAREARLRRAGRAGEAQAVAVALAARGRRDGEARLAGPDAREREPQRQSEPRRGAAVGARVERVERGGERLPRGVLARRDGRRRAQAGRHARTQARDVDATLDPERADAVDLPVDVAGLTVGAR